MWIKHRTSRSNLLYLVGLCVFSLSSSVAIGKEWCEVPGKGGYFAEKCPQGTTSKAVEDSRPKVVRWEPLIGMSAEEVRRVTESVLRDRSSNVEISPKWWGGPEKINTTKTARGTREQWVFGNEHARWYLYFDNGVLTGIQE